ncbi:hypothetical protein JYK14_24605 [Siccirubricoccus sp. KC 17139]|uniref:Uncharacterized protein n=1 Tax=Siccirubricoccus soli TaxID=2899147 RepID=A0ABT1DBK4_9PROT|nr:hypothetical protein [Siccirubricoccus soli]MCP2685452.1 hypothetical protein [Siccirubricoccus soli]
MRQGILALNATHRCLLSNDLGAVGGLLFDVGSGRYPAPPREDDAAPGPPGRRTSPACATRAPR